MLKYIYASEIYILTEEVNPAMVRTMSNGGGFDFGAIVNGIVNAILSVVNAFVSAISTYAPAIVTFSLVGMLIAGILGYLDRIPIIGRLFAWLRGRLF